MTTDKRAAAIAALGGPEKARDLLRLAQIVGDLNTALDAFDFKEETNGS